MVDGAGERTWSAEISTWGGLRGVEGERHACPFRWPGQYEDAETGLFYNRFRYYDPGAGEYISQDPIGLAGGLALHGYVGDPLTWIDPSGLTGCRDASRGGKTFLHGSDVKTVDNLVDTGLNRSAARELGGGDVFWMTEDLSTARVFAQVNPTGGPAAVAGTRLPGEVVDSLVGRGVMRFDAPTGAWQVVDWDAFNQAAKFFRVE